MADDQAKSDKGVPFDDWPVGWDAHRRDQIVFIAKNTTPAQRFKWLMDMLELLRPQMPELLKNRELLEARWCAGGKPELKR